MGRTRSTALATVLCGGGLVVLLTSASPARAACGPPASATPSSTPTATPTPTPTRRFPGRPPASPTASPTPTVTASATPTPTCSPTPPPPTASIRPLVPLAPVRPPLAFVPFAPGGDLPALPPPQAPAAPIPTGTYVATLPYASPSAQALAHEDPEPGRTPGPQAAPPIAAGLLLLLGSAHLARLRRRPDHDGA